MNKSEKSNRWGILTAVLILYLLPFYYAKLFSWPCAEDYGWSATKHGGFSLIQAFADAWHLYLTWGGRYLCYASEQLMILFMLHHAAYVGCCIFTGIIAFIPILGIMLELGQEKSFRENLFWALLCLAAAYSALAGLEQTFYWVSNIFSATLGLIALLYSIWMVCRLWRRERFSYPAFLIAMLAAFISPGFYEHAAIAQFYFAVSLLLCAWWLKRRRQTFTVLSAWSIIWVGIMILAPGNLHRQVIHQAANSILESLFMSSRAIAGIGFHTIFSPWLFAIPAFIASYDSPADSIGRSLNTKRRSILLLFALCVPVTIAVLHVLARYPIVFNGRTGDSLLIISWIGLIWLAVIFSDKLAMVIKRLKFAPYLPVIAVMALFVTGNTFGLWKNIFNGSLNVYAAQMQKRHDDYKSGKGKDISVTPISVSAWPAQKICLPDISYLPDGGVNLEISNSFDLRSVRLLPSLPEVREFMRRHPDKLSSEERIPSISGIDGVRMVLVSDVPAGTVKEEWLEVQVTGTEQGLGVLRYLRLIVMTDECFRPVLKYFAGKQAFPRLSPVMAAAVYGSRQNHVNYDLQNPETPIERIKLDNGKWRWSLLIPVNGSRSGHTKLIFYSLDTRIYFKGYQK
ncbi:MAG: DUF6056 family protein [Victivallaceae bacterium]|jgi:hypothetical protein